jgi:hypothetical protein
MSTTPHLDMAQLRDLQPRLRHRDRAARLEPVEEPLLHRVVVQRPVDVHRADAGPLHAPFLQQGLRVQLALVPALRVPRVALEVGHEVGLEVHARGGAEDVLVEVREGVQNGLGVRSLAA